MLSKPMARAGSPAREVAEVVEADILAEVVHWEERIDSSSMNYGSDTEH
jgi:hypothetical protein